MSKRPHSPSSLPTSSKRARLSSSLIPSLSSVREPAEKTVISQLSLEPQVPAAWKEKYQGNIHESLLKNIDTDYAGKRNCAAMVQSSGYGKSRSVDEMAKVVFTIPLNVRFPGETTTQAAYPPSDEALYNFFVADRKVTNATSAARFMGFLAAEVGKEVKTMYKDLRKDQIKTIPHSQLAAHWREHLSEGDHRKTLYERVVEAFDSAQEDLEFVTEFQDLHEMLPCRNKQTWDDASTKSTSPSFKILMYIDEAHTLLPSEDKASSEEKVLDYNLYELLNSCIVNLCETSFALFLSTHLRIDALAKLGTMVPSARVLQYKANLIPLITEAAFDLLPEWNGRLLLDSPKLTLSYVEDFEFLSQYGRPLWYNILKNIHPPRDGKREILELAGLKLLGVSDPSDPSSLKAPAKLAILDSLLGHHIHPRQTETRPLQLEMIARHMSTAFCVSRDRQLISSGYPSEPVLSTAMLSMVRWLDRTFYKDTLADILNDLELMHPPDSGQRGEQVAMIVLLHAYAAAVDECYEPPAADNVKGSSRGCFSERYAKSVPLDMFLKHLFIDEHYQAALQIKPCNRLQETSTMLGTEFKHYRVRFNHFIRAVDTTAMTARAAFAAFLRCAAVVGSRHNPSFDFMIPLIYDSGDPNEPLDMTKISTFLCSVKQVVRQGQTVKTPVNEAVIPFFPLPDSDGEGDSDFSTDVPYISLVMDLAASRYQRRSIPENLADKISKKEMKVPTNVPSVQMHASLSKVLFTEGPPRQSDRLQELQPPSFSRHPCYSIFTLGCSVYRHVDADQYRRLLKVNDLLGIYPRPASNRVILNMKPYWGAGRTYTYLQDPYLNPIKANAVPKDIDQDFLYIDSFDHS